MEIIKTQPNTDILMQQNTASLADSLLDGIQLAEDTLTLTLNACSLRVRSNSTALIKKLGNYFSHVASDYPDVDIEVIAIEQDALNLPLDFKDWKREPRKTVRKDAYIDLADGRLLLKVRTGMVFLQSAAWKIACGPCLSNDNQVINFINSQYMNWLQQHDWKICHAAGIALRDRGLAIAGFSGGGKSTLMLKLLDHKQISYLTNDRLFIRRQNNSMQACGIPKLPRINPGTIIHNPKLSHILPEQRRAALLKLPIEELWNLEEKYDVFIDQIYGDERFVQQAPLSAFLVLNWERVNVRDLQVQQINLAERRDLLGAIMKSPGPFYQTADGTFLSGSATLDEQAYLQVLDGVPIYEASGRVDFQGLSRQCLTILQG